MRKIYLITGLIAITLLFAYCHGSKKAMAAAAAKPNYQNRVQGVIEATCSPCHFPAKNGNKKALDTYAGVSGDIDDIIRRIELYPGEKGFMPFMHERLPDSTIALIKQWKEEGMPEN